MAHQGEILPGMIFKREREQMEDEFVQVDRIEIFGGQPEVRYRKVKLDPFRFENDSIYGCPAGKFREVFSTPTGVLLGEAISTAKSPASPAITLERKFTLLARDRTATRTVAFWIMENIETATEDTLRAALEDALLMRQFYYRNLEH